MDCKEFIIYGIPFALMIVAALIYRLSSKAFDYSEYRYHKHRICLEKLSANQKAMVRSALKKVNGWNTLTVYYTIFHYLFNLWSILFSGYSIYFTYLKMNHLSMVNSFLAILCLWCNLFLRCDRKWSTYRRALAKGRKQTNSFIMRIELTEEYAKEVEQYINGIIEIESKLSSEDIS